METFLATLRGYFRGEVQGGIGFASVGVIALVAAFLLWRSEHVHRAMFWPLLVIGIIEAVVGVGVSVRTPRQVATLERQLADSPDAFRREEGARMQKVMKSFATIKVVELVLFVAAVAITYWRAQHPVWFGVALGLLLQSAAMLVMDLLAEHRARVYLAAIQALGRAAAGS